MKKKLLYSIGAVSEALCLHPQTIRKYERLGLISPSRTEGNTRLYSDGDIERLKFVIKLTQDMGVNHAGALIILEMQEHIAELEGTLEKLNLRIQELISPPGHTGKQIIRIKVNKE